MANRNPSIEQSALAALPHGVAIGRGRWHSSTEVSDESQLTPIQAKALFLTQHRINYGSRRTINIEYTVEPRDLPQLEVEPPQVPRWAQVIAGILLLPISLLCLIGACTIFTLPKVQDSPPLLLLATAITLGTFWAVFVSVRLVFGLRRDIGLFGPSTLRFIAVGAFGIVVSGIFTGYYAQKPAVGGLMAISYVLLVRRLWALAAKRSIVRSQNS